MFVHFTEKFFNFFGFKKNQIGWYVRRFIPKVEIIASIGWLIIPIWCKWSHSSWNVYSPPWLANQNDYNGNAFLNGSYNDGNQYVNYITDVEENKTDDAAQWVKKHFFKSAQYQ